MKKLILLLVTIISLTSFFPSDSVKNSVNKILVIKHKRKLYLYHNDEVVKKYSISLGKQPIGHKEFEGDMKTPEGIYKIDSKSLTSSYHKNLGISYPNKKDKAYAKKIGKSPGGQIKIHGLPNNKKWLGKLHLLKDWTYGCIAVTNKEIDEIFSLVSIGTVIEIRP